MNHLRRPFQLGKLTLPSNIFCAPLAGCSDLPFRRMTKAYQPGLIYCEMVKMDALVRHDLNTYKFLDYETGMHPIGAQLCGSKANLAGKSAKILEDLGFDVIDLNCGCPVDKVTKDGSGSGLLKDPELIGEILSNMVAAVNVPVTVKIRAGWSEDLIVATEITRIAEQAGAKAICIHGRTRSQGYTGYANWDYIRACKEAAKEILVIGNGDLFNAECVQGMFDHTNCDAVLIARGTMGTPWIIEDVYRKLSGESAKVRTGLDYRDAFLEHLAHVSSYQTERKALLDMRRISCWYMKGAEGAKEVRHAIQKATSLGDIRQLIFDYPWDTMSLDTSLQEESCEVSC
jgi:tRNA-dihydrouridine synthase B